MTTTKHPEAPEHCQFCEWTNDGLVNYGEPGEPQWLCHGCAGMMVRRAIRQRKSTLVVDYNNPDDMLRHASLFTHDMALPSSTHGEVSLGRCVERLVADLKQFKEVVAAQLHYDIQALLSGTPESRAKADLGVAIADRDAFRDLLKRLYDQAMLVHHDVADMIDLDLLEEVQDNLTARPPLG